MSDDADTTLVQLRSVGELLEEGNLKQALSQMERIDSSCSICGEYISEGKRVVKEAIVQCSIPPEGKNEECKALMDEVIEIISILEEGYSLDA